MRNHWGKSLATFDGQIINDVGILYTITYKSRLTQKNGTKKPMLFLISMGKMGLSHDIFFKFSVGPFEVVEVE